MRLGYTLVVVVAGGEAVHHRTQSALSGTRNRTCSLPIRWLRHGAPSLAPLVSPNRDGKRSTEPSFGKHDLGHGQVRCAALRLPRVHHGLEGDGGAHDTVAGHGCSR